MKPLKYSFTEKESDITIISELKSAIYDAKKAFLTHRKVLENYVKKNKEFLESFSPVKISDEEQIIMQMAEAAEICGVGPMASVAGVLADLMILAMKSSEVHHPPSIALVENGGEIAIDSKEPMKIALYAGENQLNLNLGFLIEKEDCPIGIGTSSATIGHAISLGQADAVTIFARNAGLADAAATKICNLVKGPDIEKSIKKALDSVDDLEGVNGAFISRENKVGQIGKLPKFIRIDSINLDTYQGKIKELIPPDFDLLK